MGDQETQPAKKDDRPAVRITIEIIGKIKQENMEQFFNGIRTTIYSSVENGGGGS